MKARIDAFNGVLHDLAAMFPGRILVIDVGEIIHDIAETGKLNGWGTPNSKEEYYFDGVALEPRMGLYSIFPLDGLHFNQRGCAILADRIVTEMNNYFTMQLPRVDMNNYRNIPQY